MGGGWNQRTLARSAHCAGIGLHSGAPASVTLWPAPPDAGLRFFRRATAERGGLDLPARADRVVDTTLSTTLGDGAGGRVGTVEHLLAALAGLGVDNCRIEVDGPEVPVLDGSAAPWVRLVQEAGVRVQPAGKRFLVVRAPVEVGDGDRSARLEPARELSIRFTADFDHPLITAQTFDFAFSDRRFAREVAPARTFCFLRDVQRMQAAGLALGGSLDNAIVVDDFAILNPGGLRFPDEFARHKVLDALGDLSLLGAPVIGRLVARKSGHALHQALVRRLLAEPQAWQLVQVTGEREAEPEEIALPALAPGGAAF